METPNGCALLSHLLGSVETANKIVGCQAGIDVGVWFA